MASIGEQIRDARKAKGITQDALAETMNVTRQAVSHWETNRTMPDAETLIRLSRALSHNFVDAEEAPVEVPAPAEKQPEAAAPVSLAPSASGKRKAIRPVYLLIGALALVCAVLACLLLANRAPVKERMYKSPTDGETYTAARFQQEAANEAGKAWLRVNPSLSVSHGENYDYWMYDIRFYEMNGVALAVDRVEQVIFSREKENVESLYTAADIRAYGLSTDIPAYGDWSWQGGLPVQDTVTGVGVLLRCTDANGAALSFTAYIPLAEQ